ncbi:hypothetical protein AN958_10842 [Leucoagaricus sp. SymC.cos]|nr:hypothetical protein AN958_10842 [Leucoagaricus sp. SymC.cos]
MGRYKAPYLNLSNVDSGLTSYAMSINDMADTTAAKDPIRDYFDRYPDFVYDPSAPVPRNFDRLVEQNGWPIGSTRFKAALAQIEAALFRHFDDSIEVPGPPVEPEAGSADSGFFAYGIESFATKVPRGILSESASNDIAISCTTLQNLYSNNLIGLFSKTTGVLVLLGGGRTSSHGVGKKKANRNIEAAAKALENAEGLEAGVSDTAGTAPLQGACVEAAADGDSELEGFDLSVTGFVPSDAQTIPPQAKQPTASDDVHTKAATDEKLCTERLGQVDADTTDVKPTSLSDLDEAKSDTRNGRGDKYVSHLFTSNVRRVKREEDSDADSVQASHASDEWQVLDSSEKDDNSSLHVQVVGRFTSADYDRALADMPSLANNDVINILGLHRKAWLVLCGHGPGVYQDYTSASRNAQLDPNLGVSASVRECRSIEDADRQFVHLYMRGMIQRTGPELHGTILPFQLKAQGLADSTPDDETSWWVVPLSCSPGCYIGRTTAEARAGAMKHFIEKAPDESAAYRRFVVSAGLERREARPTSSGEIAPSNTESTPPVVIPRTPLNPIDAFFGKYPEFDANRDRTLSVATQLNQLRKQEEWWGDRYGLWVDALEKYHEALVLQFNASYGTDAENLENWHRLLRAIGGGLRKTVYECKVIISMIYVNIVDLVDVSLDPAARPVSVVFDSVELHKHSTCCFDRSVDLLLEPFLNVSFAEEAFLTRDLPSIATQCAYLPTCESTTVLRLKGGGRVKSAAELRPKDPLEVYFTSFEGFEYRSNESASKQMKRLMTTLEQRYNKQFEGRIQGSGKIKAFEVPEVVKEGYQTALVEQFNTSFGKNVNELKAWHKLLRHCRVPELPATVPECKKIVERKYINLVDLVDARHDPKRQVTHFATEYELSDQILAQVEVGASATPSPGERARVGSSTEAKAKTHTKPSKSTGSSLTDSTVISLPAVAGGEVQPAPNFPEQDYLETFFRQHYPGFNSIRDRGESLATQMGQLRELEEWWGSCKDLWDIALGRYQDALVLQFNAWYGTDVDDLETWHRVLKIIGVDKLPETVSECKQLVDSLHVNLVDLVDASLHPPASRKKIEIFNSVEALSEYTVGYHKFFPKKHAKAGGVLRYLLRKIMDNLNRKPGSVLDHSNV